MNKIYKRYNDKIITESGQQFIAKILYQVAECLVLKQSRGIVFGRSLLSNFLF